MGRGKNWTSDEEDFIREHWGTWSIDRICKRLGRTRNAVIVRVRRMGLPPFLECGDYVTLSQLITAFNGGRNGYNYKTISWGKNRGLPVHRQKRGDVSIRVVYLDEFWEWAEKNKSFLDFSKMEPLALGEEPSWVAEQRRRDFTSNALQRKDPWTPEEDQRLIYYLSQHKYGYAELSEMLNRSNGAIQRRCRDLGLNERPVRRPTNPKENEWTERDFLTLADGIRNGESYAAIGKAVGRSEKAVRGKVYTVYLTENADKIRAMLGNGPWGTGAPEPKVRQAINLSRTAATVRRELSWLVTVLSIRRAELGYEPYWQKAMCTHWNDVKGCLAGETNCDTCTQFQRIRPQYCARCGCTFIERSNQTFCPSCRTARKKKAQRKWRREHAG